MMKHLTNRQHKRKKVQIFNRNAQLHSKTTATRTDCGSDLNKIKINCTAVIEDCDNNNNKMVTEPKTKVDPSNLTKSPSNTKGSPKQHEGIATTTTTPTTSSAATASDKVLPKLNSNLLENRRQHLGLSTFHLPLIDRDLDCYYHRKVPLTLGNFMDLDRLDELSIAKITPKTTINETITNSSSAAEKPKKATNQLFREQETTTTSVTISDASMSSSSSSSCYSIADILDRPDSKTDSLVSQLSRCSRTDVNLPNSEDNPTFSELDSQDKRDIRDIEQHLIEAVALNASINALLTQLEINTPCPEFARLTFTMLQNTAFGALATGTPSTLDNIPSYEFWPHPYQINNEVAATSTLPRLEASPSSSVRPIGYECKCKNEHPPQHQQAVQQHLEANNYWPPSRGNMWQPWLQLEQPPEHDPNPNNIVDSIKCILRRHKQFEEYNDSWTNWSNHQSRSIWSVAEPQLQQDWHQRKLQQQQQQQTPNSSWDQRSQAIIAYLPEYQQQVTATFSTGNSNATRYNHNRNFVNYNSRIGGNRLIYQQQLSQQLQLQQSLQQQQAQQQPLHPQQHQQSLEQQAQHQSLQQQQHMRFNYSTSTSPNQQQQQPLQLQHLQHQPLPQQSLQQQSLQQQQLSSSQQPWQAYQQYRQPRPRLTLYPTRFYKGSSNDGCNRIVARKYFKYCCCNDTRLASNTLHTSNCCYYSSSHSDSSSSSNSNSNNVANLDVTLLNMSQDDLDAAQMYAIHGERFFEMPMGRRYQRSLYPAPSAVVQPAASSTATGLAAPSLSPMPTDLYQSNGQHISNWQTTPMSMYTVQVATTTPPSSSSTTPFATTAAATSSSSSMTALQQSQVTASVCSDAKLYTANFPPLPVPNQKRQNHNHNSNSNSHTNSSHTQKD